MANRWTLICCQMGSEDGKVGKNRYVSSNVLKIRVPEVISSFSLFPFLPIIDFFLSFGREIAKVTLSGQIPRLGSNSQDPIIRVHIPRYWNKSQGIVTLPATADSSDTFRQGHRNRGGSGGSYPPPPSLKPWGRCPPPPTFIGQRILFSSQLQFV